MWRDVCASFSYCPADGAFVYCYAELPNPPLCDCRVGCLFKFFVGAGIGRKSLYKALGENGTPEFGTVRKPVRAMGLSLSAVPLAAGSMPPPQSLPLKHQHRPCHPPGNVCIAFLRSRRRRGAFMHPRTRRLSI
ncbi:DNA-binding protein [Agrobacterium sp. ES01]|uniref:helix-turn-helix domain-containing transcriptional regulator n=1 Tax=Agrobacterium sp. ES01 TaxID=3420714 RepID=UPI003D12998F